MAEANWCRLCAVQKDSFVGIYGDEGLRLNLERKICKCLHIQLSLEDKLPKIVCLDCCAKLNNCSDFLDASAYAQLALNKLFQENIDERTVVDHQHAKSLDQNLFSSPSQPDILAQEERFSDEERAEQCEHPDYRNPLLANNSPGRPEDDQGSKRKRRVPMRHSVQLKMSEQEHDSDLLMSSPASSSNHHSGGSGVPHNGESSYEEAKQTTATKAHAINPRKRRDGWEMYPWMCTDCSQELPNMQALRSHHQTAHNQAPRFMCAQCSKVYTKYYGFVSHVRCHRNNMKFCCEECGKCFSNKKVLESHRATHSDARPFVCSECGKSFRQQSALYVHSRSHMPESVRNRFPCDQCDKCFSTKPNLVTHKRIHTGIRNFTCDQCGKSFVQKGNLDAHMLTHSAEKPHLCSVCNKGFKTPLQLRKHQTVHTGAKPHQCDVCGRQFRERGTLREHHRIHTGAMPFTCEFCGKHFRFKGILTTHRRQHTGERPYSCLQCQHHFTNWPNYNKHMKRRHGINTSQQSDPNKTALANLNNATNGNSNPCENPSAFESATSRQHPTLTTTSTLLMIQQPPPEHHRTTGEHCPTILGLSSDIIDHSSLTPGTSIHFNHQSETNAISCVDAHTLSNHTVCNVGDHSSDHHLHQHTSEHLGTGSHYYNPTSNSLVDHYVGATAVSTNALGFYNQPQPLLSQESDGRNMDLLPSVPQR